LPTNVNRTGGVVLRYWGTCASKGTICRAGGQIICKIHNTGEEIKRGGRLKKRADLVPYKGEKDFNGKAPTGRFMEGQSLRNESPGVERQGLSWTRAQTLLENV